MRARGWMIVLPLLLCAVTASGEVAKLDSTLTTHLVVCGEANVVTDGGYGPDGFLAYVYNTRSGALVTTVVGEQESGVYEAIFLDLNNNPVAAVGDVLELWVYPARFLSPDSYTLTQADINANVAVCDLMMTNTSVPDAAWLNLESHPNPFNPRTTIAYSITQAGRVRLSLYDVAGRMVRVLVDEDRSEGDYSVVWEGDDGSGEAMPSGVYILRLETAEGSSSRKLTLAR